jgi:long-chain fatty acid transport protein
VAFDQGAVDETHRTPRIPDNDRKWVSVGASYTLSKRTAFDVGFTHIFVSDGRVNLSAAGDNTTRGSLTGLMKAEINILGFQVRHSF